MVAVSEVFILSSVEGRGNLFLKSVEDQVRWVELSAALQPISPAWERVCAEILGPDEKPVSVNNGLLLEFAALRPALIGEALAAVGPLFSRYGELLPLDLSGGVSSAIFNCLNSLDAVDVDRSDPLYSRDGLRILNFDRYVFKEKNLQQGIFTLPSGQPAEYFFTDAIVATISSRCDMSNVTFASVWRAGE